MKKSITTYTMHDVETGRGTLTLYVDDTTKKGHHGVYHSDRSPVTLYPYEADPRENALDIAQCYTLAQVKSKLEHGTICFR